MHSLDMSFHIVFPRPKSGLLFPLAGGTAQANDANVSVSAMQAVNTSLMANQVVDVTKPLSVPVAIRQITDKVSAVGLLVFSASQLLDRFLYSRSATQAYLASDGFFDLVPHV
jgi:hypothetical protein